MLVAWKGRGGGGYSLVLREVGCSESRGSCVGEVGLWPALNREGGGGIGRNEGGIGGGWDWHIQVGGWARVNSSKSGALICL